MPVARSFSGPLSRAMGEASGSGSGRDDDDDEGDGTDDPSGRRASRAFSFEEEPLLREQARPEITNCRQMQDHSRHNVLTC